MNSPHTNSPSPSGPTGGTPSSPAPPPSAQGSAGWQPPSQPPITQPAPEPHTPAQPAGPASRPTLPYPAAGQAPASGSPTPGGPIYPPAGPPSYPATPYPAAGYQIQPGIIPLRPLSVTEILSGAFNALRANPAATFLPSVAVMSVLALVTGAASYLTSRSFLSTSLTQAEASTDPDAVLHALGSLVGTSSALTLTSMLATTIGTAVITGLIIVTVSRSVLGRVITPSEAWDRTRRRVPALIGQSLLLAALNTLIVVAVAGVCIAVIVALIASAGSDGPGLARVALIGLLALITIVLGGLAALVLWVRLSVAPAALVLENIGVVAAIRRSWQLTRGGFWHVLGALLLAALITATASGILSGAIGVVATLLTEISGAEMALTQAAVTGISSLLTAITLPFYASVFALTYIDLRMRREGLDLELRQVSA